MLARSIVINALIVIVNSNRENFLGVILANDVENILLRLLQTADFDRAFK